MFNLGSMLGAMGLDANKITAEVASIHNSAKFTADEMKAQGKMMRAICEHLGLEVLPETPLPENVSSDNGNDA